MGEGPPSPVRDSRGGANRRCPSRVSEALDPKQGWGTSTQSPKALQKIPP